MSGRYGYAADGEAGLQGRAVRVADADVPPAWLVDDLGIEAAARNRRRCH